MELRPAAKRVSQHRIGWRRKLGTDAEALPRASFDGEALRLPETLAIFPRRDANEALYLWLAASAAHAPPTAAEDDPCAPIWPVCRRRGRWWRRRWTTRRG